LNLPAAQVVSAQGDSQDCIHFQIETDVVRIRRIDPAGIHDSGDAGKQAQNHIGQKLDLLVEFRPTSLDAEPLMPTLSTYRPSAVFFRRRIHQNNNADGKNTGVGIGQAPI
jgi:hypothetical protein